MLSIKVRFSPTKCYFRFYTALHFVKGIVISTVIILLLSLIFLAVDYVATRYVTGIYRATVSAAVTSLFFLVSVTVARDVAERVDPYCDTERLALHCVRLALICAIVISAASLMA